MKNMRLTARQFDTLLQQGMTTGRHVGVLLQQYTFRSNQQADIFIIQVNGGTPGLKQVLIDSNCNFKFNK